VDGRTDVRTYVRTDPLTDISELKIGL